MPKGNHKLVDMAHENHLPTIEHPIRADGVKLLWGDNESGWKYTGEAADLIAAGLVLRKWLPGETGCPSANAFTFLFAGRRVQIVKNTSSRFLVQIGADVRESEVHNPADTSAHEQSGDIDDDDWPPHVGHNPAIEIGDGTRWHYKGTAEALLLAGLLDADEIPGNPECKYKWRTTGWHEDRCFQASRLGKHIVVTLLAENVSIIRCPVLRFNVR